MDVLDADIAIVQAVITMGHALGMKITAEGVERVDQAARLRRLGCDTAMGFYWTSAVDPDELLEMLRDSRARTDSGPRDLVPAGAYGLRARNPDTDAVG
jgi:EAL domain-containing protein (putative c-di-GMP-specific phosphodiesterase class I)